MLWWNHQAKPAEQLYLRFPLVRHAIHRPRAAGALLFLPISDQIQCSFAQRLNNRMLLNIESPALSGLLACAVPLATYELWSHSWRTKTPSRSSTKQYTRMKDSNNDRDLNHFHVHEDNCFRATQEGAKFLVKAVENQVNNNCLLALWRAELFSLYRNSAVRLAWSAQTWYGSSIDLVRGGAFNICFP